MTWTVARRSAVVALAALSACASPDAETLFSSGTVEATDARLSFRVPGKLVLAHAREGDAVEAGTLLAVLDQSEAEARLGQAEAQQRAARARLHELETGFRSEEIGEARAAVEAARDRFAESERELTRSTRLFEGEAISREAHDRAETARGVARSQLTQAEERLSLVEAGYRAEQIEGQRAQVAMADAGYALAEAFLRDHSIEAPFDGIVTVRHREPGEVVAPGAPVLTLLNREDRWVRIFVKEDRIGAVHLGARADIRSDTFPEKTYRGEVVFISPEAEFTPKNVQTQEERVRLVYAVKVRIVEDPGHELKPGMPADVVLDLAGAGAGS